MNFPHKTRDFFRAFFAFVCSITLVTSAFSQQQNIVQAPAVIPVVSPPAIMETNKSNKRIWNLQDADILSVINEVSQETGKNFIVDPRVTGKITLVSSKPLRQGEVYQVFLSVLSLLGYSAVTNGNVIKIVPNMESGEQATRLVNKAHPGLAEEVVVRVVPLENISATQLIPVLRPLLPQWSNVSAYTPGNVIILLGRASNLDRIYNIIQEVDQAANSGIQRIPLHHASAMQVANVLNNLQTAARSAGETPNISIAVDERTNSILLGGTKALRLRMRVLIADLDSPSTTPEGNTEVIYLRYLQAKTFAPLLGKIAANMLGKNTATSTPDVSTSIANVTMNTNANKPADVPSNLTNIQAEPNANAIIITAPPTLMRALKSVITKLDIRPAEVQVEAIIAEVDETNLRSLGVQWGGRGPSSRQDQETQRSAGTAITDLPPIGAGGIFGIIPGGVKIRAVVSMLENLNGVDILSTPSIVVLDNQKATIEVGQDVPFQSGSYATSSNISTVQPFNTIQSKPVTLKLVVTPQVNLGSSVRLQIELKNDSLQNPQNPTLNPIINTSSIKNSVIIRSDDILVIGGLISNSNNENINKVPFLGDAPLIGPLFRQKTRNVSKKNLMVFIKPIIMNNNDESMLITNMKYNAIRRIQANFREDLEDIGKRPAPTRLPPWKNTRDLPLPFGNDA